MSERPRHRKPATFKLDDPGVTVIDPDDSSRPSRGTIHITPELEAALLPVPVEAPIVAARRGFRWGTVFWAAVGGLILLGLGLSTTRLIEDLFARSEGLGYLGSAFALAAALALVVVVAREAFGLARLAAIEKMHLRAAATLLSDDRAESRTIVQDLLKLAHQNPQLARARATLQEHADDIIDGADLIRLAERAAFGPSTQALIDEAVSRDIPYIRLDRHSLVQLGQGVHQQRIRATMTSRTAAIAVDIASDKSLTNKLLDSAGLPVPRSELVDTEDGTVAAAKRLGYPCVVKPLDGARAGRATWSSRRTWPATTTAAS